MVLFVSYSGALGGAERLLLELAGGLEGEVGLACPDGELAAAAREAGWRWFPLHERSLILRGGVRSRVAATAALLAHALELRRIAVDLGPELTVLWSMRSAIAGLFVARPLAVQQNDFLPGPMIGWLVRRSAARADLVTAPSRAVASDLDPRRRLRLHVVHPGIDIERFSASAAPAEPPVVLALGAVAESKRPDLALEACALVRRTRPEVRLRLVGGLLDSRGAVLLDALRSRAQRDDLRGAVEFVGAVGDVRPELARATCLLHCAPREAFGLAVLEALASGRPAVVPAGAGPEEIVDSSCGIVYPPGDVRAAAEAIVALLERPEQATAMGAAGRERARTRFASGEARSRYASLVASVPARPRSGVPASSLALVTVSHNSAAHLRRLLRSVQRHLPGARVIVVDCASEDESVEVARSFSASCVPLGENVGFGRANNRGLAEVREPLAVLVNPDVELLDDSLLEVCAQALRRDHGERLLAPLVLSPDGSRQDTVHPAPASPADLVRSLVPPGVVPGRLGAAVAPWRALTPRRVGWAVGCALVARTETLRRLGPFDESIFMYGEDLDLSLRALEAGVETWFWPAARVVHHQAHSTEVAFGGEAFERLAQARHDVVSRRLGPRRAALDDAAQAVTFASRMALKRALGRPAERERRQLAALARQSRAGCSDVR